MRGPLSQYSKRVAVLPKDCSTVGELSGTGEAKSLEMLVYAGTATEAFRGFVDNRGGGGLAVAVGTRHCHVGAQPDPATTAELKVVEID